MSQYFYEACKGCGRTRLDGWILVDGECLDCNPEAFKTRKRALLEQARELLDQARLISEAEMD